MAFRRSVQGARRSVPEGTSGFPRSEAGDGVQHVGGVLHHGSGTGSVQLACRRRTPARTDAGHAVRGGAEHVMGTVADQHGTTSVGVRRERGGDHLVLVPDGTVERGAVDGGERRQQPGVLENPHGEDLRLAGGDRAHDVLGAAAHGLPCVGAGWGPAPVGELDDAGAAVVAEHPADVLDAVARL